MIKELILKADKIISKHCKNTSDEKCDNNDCKYCINLENEQGYLCAKVFQLANDYQDEYREEE